MADLKHLAAHLEIEKRLKELETKSIVSGLAKGHPPTRPESLPPLKKLEDKLATKPKVENK